MRRFRLCLVGLTLLSATLVNGCCWFLVAGAATGAAVAYSYQVNKLEANVDATVEATHRALLLGLNDLNIQVISETKDQISGRIEARTAAAEKIAIDESLFTPRVTFITVRVGMGLSSECKSKAEAIYGAMDKHLQSKQ
jgi:hypothetical protein